MSNPVEIVSRYLENAEAIVEGAETTGVPLPVAAAVAEMESGGRQVWGNDANGLFSTPGSEDLPVTEESVKQYYDAVVIPRQADPTAVVPMNGCGIYQITWWRYFERAAAEGYKLWVAEDNAEFGLTIFKEHLDSVAGDIARAGTLFNAGTLRQGVNWYGAELVKRVEVWEARLAEQASPGAPEVPTVPEGAESDDEVIVEVVTQEVTDPVVDPPVNLPDGAVLVVERVTITTRRRTYPSRRAVISEVAR